MFYCQQDFVVDCASGSGLHFSLVCTSMGLKSQVHLFLVYLSYASGSLLGEYDLQVVYVCCLCAIVREKLCALITDTTKNANILTMHL